MSTHTFYRTEENQTWRPVNPDHILIAIHRIDETIGTKTYTVGRKNGWLRFTNTRGLELVVSPKSYAYAAFETFINETRACPHCHQHSDEQGLCQCDYDEAAGRYN